MRFLTTTLLLATAILSSACTYTLKGRVVEGDTSYIAVVDSTDPRLNDHGMTGVRLHLQLDPGRMSRKTITRDVSDSDGAFELPVTEVGAGFLEYDVGLFARRAGYSPAETSFRLPPSSKRILIVMARGQDYDQGESLDEDWYDLKKFGN